MSDNPYQPPTFESPVVVGLKQKTRAELRRLAICQKAIMICILVYFSALFAQCVVPMTFWAPVLIVVLLDIAVGAVLVFMLSIMVYDVVVGILMALLTLVPFFGLFILVLTNGRATSILRRNGLRVGLLGADLSQI